MVCNCLNLLDSGFRRNDGKRYFSKIRIAGNKALIFRLTYDDNIRYIINLVVILLPLTSSSLIPEVIVFLHD
jgi:hypothetical protein